VPRDELHKRLWPQDTSTYFFGVLIKAITGCAIGSVRTPRIRGSLTLPAREHRFLSAGENLTTDSVPPCPLMEPHLETVGSLS